MEVCGLSGGTHFGIHDEAGSKGPRMRRFEEEVRGSRRGLVPTQRRDVHQRGNTVHICWFVGFRILRQRYPMQTAVPEPVDV